MSKTRIQVYTDEETRRRIELAAAKHDIAVTEYCLSAIQDQLAEDDLLEEENVQISVRRTTGSSPIASLRRLHDRILTRRGGRLIDTDKVLDQLREERDDGVNWVGDFHPTTR
jgi:uncharacterized protein (DUF1778 family)